MSREVRWEDADEVDRMALRALAAKGANRIGVEPSGRYDEGLTNWSAAPASTPAPHQAGGRIALFWTMVVILGAKLVPLA